MIPLVQTPPLKKIDYPGLKPAEVEASILWQPRPTNIPQQTAYHSKADRLFYGGAAGGGKSSLLLGLAFTAHDRAIVFRREYPQLASLEEDAHDIAGQVGRYNSMKKRWGRLPGGRVVEFGAVQHEKDVEKYQGRPHDLICVARGTGILMSDGTSKPIEDVNVGDSVSTLIGPRNVTRKMMNGVKPCCEVKANGSSVFLTPDHKMLTPSGWACPLELTPNLFRAYRSTSEFYAEYISAPLMPRECLYQCQQLMPSLLQQMPGHNHPQAMSFCLANDQSGSAMSDGGRLNRQRLPMLFCPRELLSPDSRLSQPQPQIHSLLSALGHDLTGSLVQDSRIGYQTYLDSCGEQAHQSLAIGLSGIPLPTDVEGIDQMALPLDDLLRTPLRSRHKIRYPHPYTKVEQYSVAHVHAHEVEIYPAGDLEVWDLTIDEACHFISSETSIPLKNCFDEITHFSQKQFEFLTGWNRSTKPGQHCRIVATGNPPTSPEGQWVLSYWGPWLDKDHPLYPATPGDLLWYITIQGEDRIVDGPEHIEIDGEIHKPHSRTFIPARLTDNPDLAGTNYASVLQAMPEPLRSQMLYGSFDITPEDDAWQVIPTAWVEAAMKRQPAEDVGLSALGVDVARGGKDQTIIAPRHGDRYGELIVFPGSATPDGGMVAAQVVNNHTGSADIFVDVVGVGSSVYDALAGSYPVHAVSGGEAAMDSRGNRYRDKAGQLEFKNLRSWSIWRFRELLDPDTSTICLPPDNKLKADLCAPRWKLTPPIAESGGNNADKSKGRIQVESKDDIKKRLGRSPDRGDAVIYASLPSEHYAIIPPILPSVGSFRR